MSVAAEGWIRHMFREVLVATPCVGKNEQQLTAMCGSATFVPRGFLLNEAIMSAPLVVSYLPDFGKIIY